jgi:hypothetical protein
VSSAGVPAIRARRCWTIDFEPLYPLAKPLDINVGIRSDLSPKGPQRHHDRGPDWTGAVLGDHELLIRQPASPGNAAPQREKYQVDI